MNEPKTTNIQKLNDEALCRLCDRLGNQVWACRRRGWKHKLVQLQSQLRLVITELGRRIDSESARATNA